MIRPGDMFLMKGCLHCTNTVDYKCAVMHVFLTMLLMKQHKQIGKWSFTIFCGLVFYLSRVHRVLYGQVSFYEISVCTILL